MKIAPAILREFPSLNDVQKSIISHDEGPLLVIAGPGSGKTFSLALRAINLFLQGKAQPSELVLCTFMEKAAYELRDRVSLWSKKTGYQGDLSSLRVTTIHGLCSQILSQNRHRTDLGPNYETLDDLTQLLFINEHFKEIIGEEKNGLFLGKWTTRWTAIEGVQNYFNKITEEMVDPDRLSRSRDPFLSPLGKAYKMYRKTLFQENKVDFSHLQQIALSLLESPTSGKAVQKSVKYLMVDEYQDTNAIQEEIILRLSAKTKNICVVGDEDQSLFRFRGATVRNILEFPEKVKDCQQAGLTANYRSHPTIIQAYDQWMASADWSAPKGMRFRYPKTIQAATKKGHRDFPTLFSIWGKSEQDEANRFADMVGHLKKKGVIEDYNQVALLLHSVRQEHSGPYLEALAKKGIKAFCPRARAYFENEEVRNLVGCFAVIFGYHGDGRGQVMGSVAELAGYVDECLQELGKQYGGKHPLSTSLRKWVTEIEGLQEKGDSLDTRPADYFYQLMAHEPFVSHLKDENRSRNLAIFSQLLNKFQNYYHYSVVTFQNKEFLKFHLFNSFLRLLFIDGINEYEDPGQPFPKDHVQVMTIHQAKGLEFPVVVVGSLDNNINTRKSVDRDLQSFYKRPPYEPEDRVTSFDRMRLHYVAFSRAEKVLVLTASADPKPHFQAIWNGLPQWPYVQKDQLDVQRFDSRERMPVKKSFSFTGDLKVYETCPRQYQFFREYDFTPSRSAVIFFGLLVHQTIEEIHRRVLAGQTSSLNKTNIKELFDKTFAFLCLQDVRPIGEKAKETAFQQVMSYYEQNKDELKRVIETEVDVSVEKDDYLLVGKVDLLRGGDGKLELLDFKASPRPVDMPGLVEGYRRQLCTYAHILEKRYGKKVDRLFLYWTGESDKKDALMEFPYKAGEVGEAGRHFDQIVGKIRAKDFSIKKVPEAKICKECDIRSYCRSVGPLPKTFKD